MSIDEELKTEIAVFEVEIRKASDSIYGTLIAHLYVEHLLERYLKAKLPNEAKFFDADGLSFTNKLKIARGFGEIEPQLLDSLSKLNAIRNDCAHVFGHQISSEQIKSLGRTLGMDYKRILHSYPEAEVGAMAPIISNICGRMLRVTLETETYSRN